MKFKITKAEFDALSPEVQAFYKASGSDYQLSIEGGPTDGTEELERMKTKHQMAEDHRKKAEKRLADAEAREEKLKKDLASASGAEAIKKIQDDHSADLERIRAERETEKKNFIDQRNDLLRQQQAQRFRSEILAEGDLADLVAERYSSRLTVEEVNGEPVVRVLDTDGKASTQSLDELQKEFVDNKAYQSVVKIKAGGGGGASPNSPGSAGNERKKLSEMTGLEEAAFEKEDPDGYAKAVSETTAG